jgi:hypothetical protein
MAKQTTTVRINAELVPALKKGALARTGGRVGDYITYLQEFYELRHLDDLADQLKWAARVGLDLRQITHLSVLNTVLSAILTRTGMR